MVTLTAIKPKGEAVQFTRFAKAAQLGLRDAADETQKLLESTTKGWAHAVEFEIRPYGDGYRVGTKDDIWNMLNKGTRPHRIEARGKKRLRFQAGRRAKTTPGRIASGSGGGGGATVFARGVNHPGTRARSWSILIRKQIQARLIHFVQKRMREAA